MGDAGPDGVATGAMGGRAGGFAAQDLTHDKFLDSRLIIAQPRRGYRAGVDPVLLAASVGAVAGQSVLELGCGGGVGLLCLARRVPGLGLTGVERQADYADLARLNAHKNGIPAQITTADLADLPPEIRARRYDHILANPPYYRGGGGTSAQDAGREAGLREQTDLATWVAVASRRLAPKGTFTMIQRADRLPDALTAFQAHLGSIAVLPIASRTARAAELVLIRGVKGGRAAFRLEAPLILHRGETHQDGDTYQPNVRAILRDAAALVW